MIIQLILITVFSVLAVRLMRQPNSSPAQAWKKLASVGFIAAAVGFVLFPEAANAVARVFGVGRGADLLLYAVTAAFIAAGLNQTVRGNYEKKRQVELVRRIAILEADLSRRRKGKA